jgi:hypothetical protein
VAEAAQLASDFGGKAAIMGLFTAGQADTALPSS